MPDSPQQEDDSALVVRLIEEGLFLNHIVMCNGDSGANISADHRYLIENVFPTLVPALQDLIKEHRDQITPNDGDRCTANKTQADPVTWLAQYLLRNNVNGGTSRLTHHPFQTINKAALNMEPT
ncbi:hypothetical protein LSCM1_01867 [Leishmania martiniquensis]|uniref:Uncharacterized protein n=1 Tax=Leishmania martiniquensis TaxID=1580590 RepID=A0A836H4A9_9TRYP|nr:hypothetical protein LSCM1_01867 [Leishmania martiniquensis]